jgi:hypothetical protein
MPAHPSELLGESCRLLSHNRRIPSPPMNYDEEFDGEYAELSNNHLTISRQLRRVPK